MNFNGSESNPIMSRIKSQKTFTNPSSNTPQIINPISSSGRGMTISTNNTESNINYGNNNNYISESVIKFPQSNPSEGEKPLIYKKSSRSRSTNPTKNNNVSSNTTVTSSNNSTINSYTNSNTNVNSNGVNGIPINNKMNRQVEEMNYYMKGLNMCNTDEEYNINTYSNQRRNYTPYSESAINNKGVKHYSNSSYGGNINLGFNRMNSMNTMHTIDNSNQASYATINAGSMGNLNMNRNYHPSSSYKSLSSNNSNMGLMRNMTMQSSVGLGYNTPVKPSYHNQHSLSSNSLNNSDCLINLEDLMLLEEKFEEIIYNISTNRPIVNECFEWWNFYFNCTLCGRLEFYFKDDSRKSVIRDYTNLELLSIILCYDSSHAKDLFEKILVIVKSILALLHQNFLIICEYILSKISHDSQTNIWVQKLNTLVENKMSLYKANLEDKTDNFGMRFSDYHVSDKYVAEIKSNNACIYDYLRIVLKNYPLQNEITDLLIAYFKNISKVNINTLNEFFRTKVIRVLNKNASVLASVLIGDNANDLFGQVAVPYLKKESLKEYTLVLDLDETLIHFKIDHHDENKGLLRLRPGIFEFLDAVSKYFELVIFTAATQDVTLFHIYNFLVR